MHIHAVFAAQRPSLPFPLDLVEAHPTLITAMSALLVSISLWITIRNIVLNNGINLVKEMQDVNLAVIKDKDLANHYNTMDGLNRGADWVRELYIVFYHLNLIHVVAP